MIFTTRLYSSPSRAYLCNLFKNVNLGGSFFQISGKFQSGIMTRTAELHNFENRETFATIMSLFHRLNHYSFVIYVFMFMPHLCCFV